MSKNASIHTNAPIADGQQSNTQARSYPSFIIAPQYPIKYPFSKEELQELRNHSPDMEKYLLHNQFNDYIVPLFAKWERAYPVDPGDELFPEEAIDMSKLWRKVHVFFCSHNHDELTLIQNILQMFCMALSQEWAREP
ncbi:hypothetical protein EDD18DRAFT_1102678 [Armillaria luteobubalina]|uniref:Uncharacterized protein n=1 Tax=Armillaria luteobubalina TaxID=153913 RepID=A0AA39QAI0_9AGAR|nr:hypothetical protein EDD18DRAFT_1102678 [Armillaria luteobubalina]